MSTPEAFSVCGKCGGPTEFGVVADAGHGHRESVLEWVRGLPGRSWVTGKYKAQPGDRLRISTLRCTACGYLEFYAPALAKTACLACGYDRRGLPTDAVCPECGGKP